MVGGHGWRLPRLYCVPCRTLAIPHTSCDVERSFSAWKRVRSEKYLRMKESTTRHMCLFVSKVLFPHRNLCARLLHETYSALEASNRGAHLSFRCPIVFSKCFTCCMPAVRMHLEKFQNIPFHGFPPSPPIFLLVSPFFSAFPCVSPYFSVFFRISSFSPGVWGLGYLPIRVPKSLALCKQLAKQSARQEGSGISRQVKKEAQTRSWASFSGSLHL